MHNDEKGWNMSTEFKMMPPVLSTGTKAIEYTAGISGKGAGADREKLEKVAEDFESYLIFNMLKEFEKTTFKQNKGYMEHTYMSILYERLGDFIADKGIGIKDMVMKNMESGISKVITGKGDNPDG